MKLVVLESPFAGDTRRNIEYAKDCLLDCLNRGEAPIASHLVYPQVLDDTDPVDRARGIEAGLTWILVADLVVVYTDLGISPGMIEGIKRATRDQTSVEYRRLLGKWARTPAPNSLAQAIEHLNEGSV